MFTLAFRFAGAVAVLVLAIGLATPARAQTCGVLEFAGDGELVSKKIRVKLTALAAQEFHGRDECPSAVVIPLEEVDEGCQDNPRCLKKLAKSRGLDYVVIGVATDGRGEREVRLEMEIFDPKKGRAIRDVTEEFQASKETLLATLPGMASQLLTGRRDLPKPEPEPEPEPEERVAEVEEKKPERREPPPEIERKPMNTCGVLEFTGSGQHANKKKLESLTTLVATEVDIVGHCELTTQYESGEFKNGCASSPGCLAEMATENDHNRMIVGTITDGAGQVQFHLRLRLYDANRGKFERTVDDDLMADMTEIRLEIPPMITELFTGERPKTAAEILAEQESEDIKLDFEMENIIDSIDDSDDVFVFGDEVTNLEVVDLELSEEERLARQEEERRRREEEERRRQEAEDEERRREEAREAISIEESDEDEIVIEPAGAAIVIGEDDEEEGE